MHRDEVRVVIVWSIAMHSDEVKVVIVWSIATVMR